MFICDKRNVQDKTPSSPNIHGTFLVKKTICDRSSLTLAGFRPGHMNPTWDQCWNEYDGRLRDAVIALGV